MERAVTSKFTTSNNKAEYDALILELNIYHGVGAKIFSPFSNSQLIVGQANWEFEAEDESM